MIVLTSLHFFTLIVKCKLDCLWQFIPWKKTYHRLKMGEAEAKRYVHKIISEEGMQQPSLRLLNLIRYSAYTSPCGFFLACMDYGGRFDDSFPALVLFFLVEIDCAHQFKSLKSRISPQWLSELR